MVIWIWGIGYGSVSIVLCRTMWLRWLGWQFVLADSPNYHLIER